LRRLKRIIALSDVATLFDCGSPAAFCTDARMSIEEQAG
jgi:hypothetical protein